MTWTWWPVCSLYKHTEWLNNVNEGSPRLSYILLLTNMNRWVVLEPSKHETSNQCWVNVGPTSLTAVQHWPNIGSMSPVCWVFNSIIFYSFWAPFVWVPVIHTPQFDIPLNYDINQGTHGFLASMLYSSKHFMADRLVKCVKFSKRKHFLWFEYLVVPGASVMIIHRLVVYWQENDLHHRASCDGNYWFCLNWYKPYEPCQ